MSESDDDNFENYVPYNIDSLKFLRYINLSGCYHITDKSLIKTFNLPELREINLGRCFNITEIGLTQICQKCPYLEIVDFSEVFHIVDSTIDMIALTSSKMETLKLNGCNQITVLALEYLRNCKYLKVIITSLIFISIKLLLIVYFVLELVYSTVQQNRSQSLRNIEKCPLYL